MQQICSAHFNLPDEIVVLMLSYIHESETIIPCLLTCKSWVSISSKSHELQRHLFKLFWGTEASTTYSSPLEHHIVMKSNFFRCLESNCASLQSSTPCKPAVQLVQAEASASCGLASQATGDVYFVQVFPVFTSPEVPEPVWQRFGAIQLQTSSGESAWNNMHLDYSKQIMCIRGQSPNLDTETKAALVLADHLSITSVVSRHICWTHSERLYLLNLNTLITQQWPFTIATAGEFRPLPGDVAHSNGICAIRSNVLYRFDFIDDAFQQKWSVSVPQGTKILNCSQTVVILSNYESASEDTDVFICAVSGETGQLSTLLNLGKPRRFQFDCMAVFYFISPYRGLFVSSDRIILLELGPELQLSILDTFSMPDHVFRVSSYAFNILLLESSSYTRFIIPDDSNILVLRIDSTKIQHHGAASITIPVPASMCLDSEFNLYTRSKYSPFAFAKYRICKND